MSYFAKMFIVFEWLEKDVREDLTITITKPNADILWYTL
jgi:hypothetical protein